MGFRPVPIQNGEKFPRQKDWPELARQNPPWAACHPVQSWAIGTGIVAAGLRGIDVDVDDPSIANQIHEFIAHEFGAAPYRFRAGSPRRLWLFRAAEGTPGKSYVCNDSTKARVEVLGQGQQFFAFGIHPSGQPLHWSRCPTSIQRDELPALTEPDVQKLLDFAAPLIGATQKQHRASDAPLPKRTTTGDEWPIGDVCSALEVIPTPRDYQAWFKLTCAIFDATGGSAEGRAAWQYWTQPTRPFDQKAQHLWRALFEMPKYYTKGTLWHAARQHDPHWDRPSRAGFTPFQKEGFSKHGTQNQP